MLALIAAFSEVSGEAAYEVSMMHLGAIRREGISTVWLLHTHTAQYCLYVYYLFVHYYLLLSKRMLVVYMCLAAKI